MGRAWALVVLLLLGSMSPASAQRRGPPQPIDVKAKPGPTERYGEWTAQALADRTFMATTNNREGAVFGVVCSPRNCAAVVNPQIDCDVGDYYPVLVNTPAGSYSPKIQCEKLGDVLVYSFALDDDLTESMSIGGIIGFAFPMASGEFKVVRFSLTGAARATARISQLAQSEPKDASSQLRGDVY